MNITEMTTTPCKILKTLPEAEKREIARTVAAYYQGKGFPYYSLTQEEQERILGKLIEFDVQSLVLENDELQQNMYGLNLVNSYHPQMWDVRCGNAKTPLEVFNDLDLFSAALYKRINYSDTKLQPFNIRKSLKVFGAYSVSNFRPTIAKYIYNTYCPEWGSVLDPCMGYGGRLLGAYVSDTVAHYTGVDPSAQQIIGNTSMAARLFNNGIFDYRLVQRPFEDLETCGKFDLVFTSPPYFNKELYDYSEWQSFVRYPTLPEWLVGFLTPLITKSHACLKAGGYFALNIAGTELVNHAMQVGAQLFGAPVTVKHMRLSKVIGTKNGDSHKTEPIIIWKKE